jgi:hypothetical protein
MKTTLAALNAIVVILALGLGLYTNELLRQRDEREFHSMQESVTAASQTVQTFCFKTNKDEDDKTMCKMGVDDMHEAEAAFKTFKHWALIR